MLRHGDGADTVHGQSRSENRRSRGGTMTTYLQAINNYLTVYTVCIGSYYIALCYLRESYEHNRQLVITAGHRSGIMQKIILDLE